MQPVNQYHLLPCLTTTRKAHWRRLTGEIASHQLTEIALYVTCVTLDERRELYDLLAATAVTKIPHVHLRDDTEEWELDYLSERYGTTLFNLHPSPAGLAIMERYPRYRSRFYLENLKLLDEGFYEGVRRCGGVCLDFSHWADFGLIRQLPQYQGFRQVLAEVPVGCCHVSAVVPHGWTDRQGRRRYNRHHFADLSEFDYLADLREYIPPIVSLELENPLTEQLQAITYIEQLLADPTPAGVLPRPAAGY